MIVLVSDDHATMRPVPIWVACDATGVMMMSGPELLPPRAMYGSMLLLQLLGSVLISMAHVATGGHRNHTG